jgi:hypothetical protein
MVRTGLATLLVSVKIRSTHTGELQTRWSKDVVARRTRTNPKVCAVEPAVWIWRRTG